MTAETPTNTKERIMGIADLNRHDVESNVWCDNCQDVGCEYCDSLDDYCVCCGNHYDDCICDELDDLAGFEGDSDFDQFECYDDDVSNGRYDE